MNRRDLANINKFYLNLEVIFESDYLDFTRYIIFKICLKYILKTFLKTFPNLENLNWKLFFHTA